VPRTGLAYDEVADAIHALEKAGVTPSIRLIREKLGRGSLSTIAEHKRAVEAQRAEGPIEALPDPIAKGLLKGAQAFWQELIEAAEAEIASVKAEHDEQLFEANSALKQAREEVASAKDALGSSQARVAELESELSKRDAALEASASMHQGLKQDLAKLEAMHTALSDERDDLKAELVQSRKAATDAIAEGARLSERLEHLAAEHAADKAASAETVAGLESEITALRSDLRQERAARRTAEDACARVNEHGQSREQEQQRLAARLAERDTELQGVVERHAAFKAEVKAERKAHKEALAAREQRIKAAQTTLEKAEARLKRYESEEHRLLKDLLKTRQRDAS